MSNINCTYILPFISFIGFKTDPKYDSGKIETDLSKLRDRTLLMYGQKSGFQRGNARFLGGYIELNAVRLEHDESISYMLNNQIKIDAIGYYNEKDKKMDYRFAQKGDSGATVFLKDGDGLSVVGVLTTISDVGFSFFTPIGEFLEAFQLGNISECISFFEDMDVELQTSTTGTII